MYAHEIYVRVGEGKEGTEGGGGGGGGVHVLNNALHAYKRKFFLKDIKLLK